MKNFKKIIYLSVVGLMFGFVFLNLPITAYAMNPTLSISATGSGDNVQMNVTGDASTSVLLFYGSQFVSIGNTNSSGVFSAVVSSATYTIASSTPVYVKTGGISGSQSSSVNWPYVSVTTTSNLTLSQSALLLSAGQTSTITASANYLYLLSNSSPSIANVNFNANQITVQALTYGSTTARICVVGSTTNCANIVVTVQNASAQQLTFSQNNFSIVSGQSISVTITGGSGSYIASNNSNPTSIQTSLNGSAIMLTATGTSGSASITVCTTDNSNCGIINVNATTLNSTAVTFSQSNPVVPIGQNTTVTIYGGTGANFYVSSNSNPSIVQANIIGNVLTLIGNATTGTSAIVICAYTGTCGTVTANVSSVSTTGSIMLSQSTISILAGQNTNITISGGSLPYSISSNSSNIFNSSINGNTLTIYGVNPGSATGNVCSSIGCVNLSVTINSINPSTNTNPITFSQNNILMNIGQQATVFMAGNGGYYASTNSYPNIASVSISGSSAIVSAITAGSDTILICQSSGQCSNLYIVVSAPVAPITPTTPVYVFVRYLGFGDKGEDVLKLQQILVEQGFLFATPNGNYGSATKAAIQKFQKSHSIKQTGNFGPSTKDKLNQIISQITPTIGSAKEQQISTIQAAIQQLLVQLAQMRGQ